MTSNEMIAYTVAAIAGGAVAGQIAGMVGALGVFAGIGLVGYAEMLVVRRRSHGQNERGPQGPLLRLTGTP